MSNFTVIGAGNFGGALGTALAAAGHNVRFQVPEPDNAKYEHLSALESVVFAIIGPPPEDTDLIFMATPWDAKLAAVQHLGDLSGEVIVDCTNSATYGPTGMTLAIDANTSAAQMIAAQLPGTVVAKCFNQVGAPVISALDTLSPAPMTGVACDDAHAKARVIDLASSIGFDAFDAGGLANANLLEAFALLWMGQAFAFGDPSEFAFGRSSRPSG